MYRFLRHDLFEHIKRIKKDVDMADPNVQKLLDFVNKKLVAKDDVILELRDVIKELKGE